MPWLHADGKEPFLRSWSLDELLANTEVGPVAGGSEEAETSAPAPAVWCVNTPQLGAM